MLEDNEKLDTLVNEFQPDVIIHLAAQAGVRYSLENPYAYMASNLVGFLNIIELNINNFKSMRFHKIISTCY